MAIASGQIGGANISYADEQGKEVGELLPMFGNSGDIPANVYFEGSGSATDPNGYTYFPGASNLKK